MKLLTNCLLLSLTLTVCAGEECIAGKYHKKTPTPESVAYPECHPWRSKTCCTFDFARELHANQTRKLYNHDWHLCKPLTKRCERFWVNQECFYQCSPYAYKWKDASGEAFKGLPICASECDRWYQACEEDEICVENVLTDYNFTSHGRNSCPKDKPCITYKKMYGSGKSLCEKMWGSSYKYTPENKDSSNCMVMWFSGMNPNKRVQVKRVNGSSKLKFDTILITFMAFSSVLSLYVYI